MNHKFFQSEKFNGMQNDEIYGYLESSDDLLIKGDVNGDVFLQRDSLLQRYRYRKYPGKSSAAIPLPCRRGYYMQKNHNR